MFASFAFFQVLIAQLGQGSSSPNIPIANVALSLPNEIDGEQRDLEQWLFDRESRRGQLGHSGE